MLTPLLRRVPCRDTVAGEALNGFETSEFSWPATPPANLTQVGSVGSVTANRQHLSVSNPDRLIGIDGCAGGWDVAEDVMQFTVELAHAELLYHLEVGTPGRWAVSTDNYGVLASQLRDNSQKS